MNVSYYILYIYRPLSMTFTISPYNNVLYHFPFSSFILFIHKMMDSRMNWIIVDNIWSVSHGANFNDQLLTMHREWAYRVWEQTDLVMELQQLRVKVPYQL